MLSILVAALVKALLFVFGFALNLSAIVTWMERRQSAMMQDRIGPVRANIRGFRLFGLLHPIADAIKLATKEDHLPRRANKVIFIIAPLFAVVPVILVFAVIPFGPTLCLDNLGAVAPDLATCGRVEHLQVAHLDIGMLFVFAVASLGVYGAVLAGWSSYNNYGLLGGLRASAQMLSYEITLSMALMGIFLVYGTLEPGELVERQSSILRWGIVQQPLAFILFFFAAIAESKRAPFDLPEGESEIVGYFVEYSGTRFMTFFLGEFLEIVFVGAVVTTLFLGGWHFPGDVWVRAHWPQWAFALAGLAAFSIKTFVLCFLQLAIRWSVPRLRYDQLMQLGWKGMLPASIANLVITAGVMLAVQAASSVR